MSYQNLTQVRQKIKDYRTNVTKLNNLRNKIKERVSDIHKIIEFTRARKTISI